MFNHPKISIITPSFNQGNYIEECINSVLSQNYPNLEYIIIDGGSTDQTIDVIKKYEKQITFWVSQPDKGQSDAINKGLLRSTGEIINWLNADDSYAENALFKVAETFLKHPKVKVVSGKCHVYRENDKSTSHYTKGADIYEKNLFKTIGWARIDQPSTFFHRTAIEKMGFLDEQLHYLMDRDWWVKYLLSFGLENIIKISEVLVHFRLHDLSKTVRQNGNFQIDRDSYFFALASKYHLEDFKAFIQTNCKINENYQIINFKTEDLALIESAINYYVLLRANEFYAINERKKAQVFLDFVKTNLLKKEDLQLWKTLHFRNQYIPLPIIKSVRRVKYFIWKIFRQKELM